MHECRLRFFGDVHDDMFQDPVSEAFAAMACRRGGGTDKYSGAMAQEAANGNTERELKLLVAQGRIRRSQSRIAVVDCRTTADLLHHPKRFCQPPSWIQEKQCTVLIQQDVEVAAPPPTVSQRKRQLSRVMQPRLNCEVNESYCWTGRGKTFACIATSTDISCEPVRSSWA